MRELKSKASRRAVSHLAVWAVAAAAGPAAAQVSYQTVALSGQSAPGTPAGVDYASFGIPVLNHAGRVAYRAFLAGSAVTSATDESIYAGTFAVPQLVARKGAQAPGAAGVSYANVNSPVLNDAGQVAYFTTLAGSGVTAANDTAIYAGAPADPRLVARRGDAAPGTAAGVSYAGLNSPAFNDAAQVAYFATLTGSGVTTANDVAIFAGGPAGPRLVAREGSQAPGTAAGVRYAGFVTPALNDAGQVVCFAVLAGNGVTVANDVGLFAFDPLGGDLLIAREGDLFDVGGGDLRTIADGGIGVSFGRSDDTLTGLANDGTLAFRLGFTDGTSGIFTAVIPEPASLSLLAAAGMLLRRRACSRA